MLSRVSPEFCNAWWNDNVAAAGFGQPISRTPDGAIPFALARDTQSGQASVVSLPLTPSHWRRMPTYWGGVNATGDGLSLQGGAWTNGGLRNGRRDGNGVHS